MTKLFVNSPGYTGSLKYSAQKTVKNSLFKETVSDTFYIYFPFLCLRNLSYFFTVKLCIYKTNIICFLKGSDIQTVMGLVVISETHGVPRKFWIL